MREGLRNEDGGKNEGGCRMEEDGGQMQERGNNEGGWRKDGGTNGRKVVHDFSSILLLRNAGGKRRHRGEMEEDRGEMEEDGGRWRGWRWRHGGA